MIKVVGASYAACFFLILHSCMAQDCASSCGNIHHIGHPFRLKTDPKHCGYEFFELACVANTAIWYVNLSGGGQVGYRVQAINYNNSTIRLVDPNVFMEDCTLRFISSLNAHVDSIYLRSFFKQFHGFNNIFDVVEYEYGYRCPEMIFWSCPFPVTGKLDGFNSSCNEVAVNNSNSASYTKRYWYVNVGAMNAYDLENACRIEYKYWTSLLPEGVNNISYKDLNNSLAYGFELYWSMASRQNRLANILFLSIGALTGFALYYKGLLCCCGTPCVTIFLTYKWRRRHLSAYDNIEKYLNCNQNNLMLVRYSYSQIKKMTNGFKEKLGEGGYGSVYKGKLQSGSFAAIKMLDKSKAIGEEFTNEVATIGRIHHTNVVQLIDFCVAKHALVYEFMVNGSLDKYVLSKQCCILINNEKIYDICLGVAHGIEYLHQGCNMQILHFDIKPHNILLDENFMPKISDFGLAKLHSIDNSIVSLTTARGTIGYMAPELFYKNIGDISYKADVYSFGMLLMEMLGKRKNLNALTENSSQVYFPSWIYDEINTENDIKREDGLEEENKIVKKMIIVALWCIQMKPVDRPSMHEVIKMLEGNVENLQIPPKPFVSFQEIHTNDAGLITCSEDTSCTYSDTISLHIEAN